MSKEEEFYEYYRNDIFGKEIEFEKVSKANFLLYGEPLRDRCLTCIQRSLSHLTSVYVSLIPVFKDRVYFKDVLDDGNGEAMAFVVEPGKKKRRKK